MKLSLSLLCSAVALFACGPETFPAVQEDVSVEAPLSGSGRTIVLLSDARTSSHKVALTENERKRALLSSEPSLEVVWLLEALPMLVVKTDDPAVLERLRADPDVADLFPDRQYEPSDVSSFSFIGQATATSAGMTGAGTAVAVLDTGLTYTHAAFGPCTAPGVGVGCRVVAARDFAAEDGQLDSIGHGTNVAGIVAGLAPGTKLLGLDVFGPQGTANSSDIIAAIDWVISQRATWNIVAINLSLGGGVSTTACPTDVFAAPLQRARTAGIVPVVAAGNGGVASGISSPACAPAAVSVGAVYDSAVGTVSAGVCTDATTAAGQVACFSNSSAFMTLWAPGVFVDAAGSTMSGTSQATPHVAGALALLAQRFPADSVDVRVSRLVTNAPTVRDARNGATRPRLSVPSMLGGCSVDISPRAFTLTPGAGVATFTVTAGAGCAWALSGVPTWATASAVSGTGSATVKLTATANTGVAREATVSLAGGSFSLKQSEDTVAPTGTLMLPALTNTTSVVTTVTATDAVGVTQVCVSTVSPCPSAGWIAFVAKPTVVLPVGDGAKTVYAWFKDARGNVSAAASAPIKLDLTAPVNGAVVGTAASGTIRLTWSGFSDATSGVSKYRLMQATTSTAPAAGCAGTALAETTTLTFSVAAAAGQVRSYRVCAVDAAGNSSTGATVSVIGK